LSVLIRPAHYIYFETSEQIESLSNFRIERVPDYSPSAFLHAVERLQPRVVFLDPLTNTVDLRLRDIQSILGSIGKVLRKPCSVIIDGTMLSGAFNPFANLSKDELLEVLYYESVSKYLQLGLDLTLAGFVAVNTDIRSIFEKLRRNTGTILYDHAAGVLPRYDRHCFITRMKQITKNAKSLGTGLNDSNLRKNLNVNYPGLAHHPDYHLGSSYWHLGGVMTFDFIKLGLNNRNMLNSLGLV
jgi:cystathionine gamma-synthase